MENLRRAIPLPNGVTIPQLGLGVYQSARGQETHDAVRDALEVGYRHIDTARIYGNERDVGAAIRESGVPRAEIFVTTKLWNADHGYDTALKAFDKSVQQLGTEWIDLYLIHWPVPRLRNDSWRALARLLQEKRCRAVGVSNYTVGHLKQLLAVGDVVPAINQVELSPFLQQPELVSFCQEKGIVLEAYSPLTQGKKLDHEVVSKIAKESGKTSAQVLIRWALQRGFVVIPKSVRRERIEENANVFDFSLSAQAMGALDALDEGFRTCWDPTDVA